MKTRDIDPVHFLRSLAARLRLRAESAPGWEAGDLIVAASALEALAEEAMKKARSKPQAADARMDDLRADIRELREAVAELAGLSARAVTPVMPLDEGQRLVRARRGQAGQGLAWHGWARPGRAWLSTTDE